MELPLPKGLNGVLIGLVIMAAARVFFEYGRLRGPVSWAAELDD